MPQLFVSLPVHLVFSTKNRAALIGDDMQSRLHEYIGGILREEKFKLVAVADEAISRLTGAVAEITAWLRL